MPAPLGRDLEKARIELQQWLQTKWTKAQEVRVGEISGPGATGFSSDTLIFDVEVHEAGRVREEALVVRVHPSGFQLFPEYDLGAQFAIMRALEPTAVPVPRMRFEEPGSEVLGQPFYVMDRVDGTCPADHPPYTAEGWLKAMPSEDQASLWSGYVQALVDIHALDPISLGLGFLAKPDLGPTPLDQELRYYRDFYRWAWLDEGRTSPDERGHHPYVEPALAWLEANKPPQPEVPRLCWGDARIGNMIFQGPRLAAVIDWEMARLGDPIMDLAWGLFMDRYHAEGNGHPRLPGFPERAATIADYEERSGRSAEHVGYYEVLAGMRFSVILIRLAKQFKHYEVMPEDVAFEVENPVSQLHGKQLRELGIL